MGEPTNHIKPYDLRVLGALYKAGGESTVSDLDLPVWRSGRTYIALNRLIEAGLVVRWVYMNSDRVYYLLHRNLE